MTLGRRLYNIFFGVLRQLYIPGSLYGISPHGVELNTRII